MKKLIGILLLSLSFFTFAATQKAPDFKALDQYSVEQSIEKYRGKFIILSFWATWCPACQSELGGFNNLYKKYGENEKEIVFLGVTAEDKDIVEKFLKDNGYSFPSVVSEEAMRKYFIRAFPTTFIIDKNGNIANYIMGAVPEKTLDQYIQSDLLRKTF